MKWLTGFCALAILGGSLVLLGRTVRLEREAAQRWEVEQAAIQELRQEVFLLEPMLLDAMRKAENSYKLWMGEVFALRQAMTGMQEAVEDNLTPDARRFRDLRDTLRGLQRRMDALTLTVDGQTDGAQDTLSDQP